MSINWHRFSPALLCAALFAAPAMAQLDDSGMSEFKGHSVTDFPRVRHLIQEAEALLDGAAQGDALKSLQEVIDRYPNQLYRTDSGIYRGAREYSMELLSRLSDSVLAAYRSTYDGAAQRLYSEAVAEQDMDGLLTVVRRFLFTSYGPQALAQLGRLHHERGEWHEAIYYYRQSIHPQFGDAVTPELLVRVAHCLAESGERDSLLALEEELAQLEGEPSVRAAGKEQSAMRQFEVILDAARQIETDWSETWPQFGGNASHDAEVSRYEGPVSQSIDVPLDFEALDPFSLTRSHRYLMSRSMPEIDDLEPPFHPVVHASIAYVHDGLRFEAINLINGKRKWFYESEPSPVAIPHPRMIFGSAYADGLVYAALETEVTDLPLRYKLTPIKLPMPRRKLHAFDAESGHLAWSHVDPDETDPRTRDFVSRASVSTPPLLWRENIYVGASYFEGKIHSFLCCFDRRTGKLRWKTLVCTGQQELNMFGNQFMEYVASPLVMDDGNLYYITNLGLVASLDARNGTIRWINEYPIIPLPHPQNFHPRIRRPSWYANPPYIHDGALLATPLDSEELLAFDTQSGEVRWTHDRERRRRGTTSRSSLYALGVVDDHLILAGDEIVSLDLTTQEIAWSEPFREADEKATGLGLIADGRIYCPTQYALHQLDARTGMPVQEPIPWERGPGIAGNLTSFENLFLSTSGRSLSIYFRWDEISKRLLTELGKHPDAIEIHLKLGDGYTHAGKLSPALDHYRKAMTLATANPEEIAFAHRARRGLYRVYTTLGDQAWTRGKADIAASFYDSVLEYAHDSDSLLSGYSNFETLYRESGDTPKLRSHYESMLDEIAGVRHTFDVSEGPIPAGLYALLKLADLDMKERNGARAVARYQQILSSFAGERIDDASSEAHAKDHIDFLIRTFGREVYTRFDQEAAQLFEAARTSGAVEDFERVLEQYPNCSLIEDCLLAFSAVLQDQGDYSRVLEILRGFLKRFPRSKLRHRVLGQVVSAYETLGYATAAAYVRSLRDNPLDTSGAVAGDGLGEGGALLREPWAERLPVPVNEMWKKPFTSEGTLAFVRVHGVLPDFFRRHLILSGDDSILCLEIDSGNVIWKRSDLRLSGDANMYYQDGRMYFSTVDEEVACIDPETGDKIWKRDFDDRVADTRLTPGTVLVGVRGPNKNGFVLHALDVLTGAPVWTRHIIGLLQKPMYTSGGMVFVRVTARSRPGRVIALEAFTGSERWEFSVEPQFKPIPFENHHILAPTGKQVLSMKHVDSRSEAWEYRRTEHWLRQFYRIGDRVAVLLDDRLVVLDAVTGAQAWERKLEDGNKLEWIPGMEEQDSDVLYLKLRRVDTKPENSLIAMDAASGKVLWERELPPNPIFVKRLQRAGSTLVVQVTQYQADPRVQVLIFDARSGESIQQLEYEGNYYAEIRIQDDNLCIITGSKLHLLRRDRQ